MTPAIPEPPIRARGKVLVAMSGGVDSSVAAALRKTWGFEVVGCFMRLGSPGESLDAFEPDEPGEAADSGCDPSRIRIGKQGCCSINDAADARLVAARLDIPFYVCNFRKDFGRIIDYFVGEYHAGRTPNPCVRCNDWLKFGRLHDYAKRIDARWVASGHYARVEPAAPEQGRPARLRRGVDHDKDQSYVLFGAPRHRLDEMLLPVGGLRKSVVRDLARHFDLPVFDKPDSQEICFVPDHDYAGLVRRRAPEAVRPGPILDPEGREIGEHPGHQHFTVGQRRGIGVALGYPVYVVERDAAANAIRVGPRELLDAAGCRAKEVNWLADRPAEPTTPFPCLARIRYNAEPVPASVRFETSESGEPVLAVRFDAPQAAVAPGQAVVCYDAADPDLVLGGGWISEAIFGPDS